VRVSAVTEAHTIEILIVLGFLLLSWQMEKIAHLIGKAFDDLEAKIDSAQGKKPE